MVAKGGFGDQQITVRAYEPDGIGQLLTSFRRRIDLAVLNARQPTRAGSIAHVPQNRE